jgi:hypothetical protein
LDNRACGYHGLGRQTHTIGLYYAQLFHVLLRFNTWPQFKLGHYRKPNRVGTCADLAWRERFREVVSNAEDARRLRYDPFAPENRGNFPGQLPYLLMKAECAKGRN